MHTCTFWPSHIVTKNFKLLKKNEFHATIDEQQDARTMSKDTFHTTLLKRDVVASEVEVFTHVVHPFPFEIWNVLASDKWICRHAF